MAGGAGGRSWLVWGAGVWLLGPVSLLVWGVTQAPSTPSLPAVAQTETGQRSVAAAPTPESGAGQQIPACSERIGSFAPVEGTPGQQAVERLVNLSEWGVGLGNREALSAQVPASGEGIDPDTTGRWAELNRRLERLEEQLRQQRSRAADRPTTQLTGMIHLDRYWTGEDSEFRQAYGALPDGVVFRRVRIGLQGTYGAWDYRIIPEFAAAGRPSLFDVFVGWNDLPALGHVRVGHFAEPFGLEQTSSIRGINTLERSVLSEIYGRRRRVGIMFFDTWDEQRGTWALGIFRSDNDVFGDDIAQRQFRSAVTGRLTRLVWYDEEDNWLELLHLGVSYSARAPKNRQVQFQARPEDRFGAASPNLPILIDTGPIPATFYQLLVGEALWIHGPFSMQGEYLLVPVSTRQYGAVYFFAWYVQASLVLTGEHRQYRRDTAVLDSVIPRRDFLRRENGQWFVGPGAWELIVRFSQADLNDGGIEGGRITGITLGVAWYLNPYMRIYANYIQTHPTPANAKPGIGHIFGVRTALEF
ncbi:MAG: OprO/OprP family phosphate-selective porin [Gemmataceae bacterium]|nr:OprO/OprP family phosphate-selective porin [Gemmataceae bacterium]